MMEGDRGARPHRSMGVLTVEEKKFLLAVERGDVASVRRSASLHLYITMPNPTQPTFPGGLYRSWSVPKVMCFKTRNLG